MNPRLKASLDEPLSPEAMEILARRAERLRARVTHDVEEAQLWVAEFTLGSTRHALRLEELIAAVPLRGVTPVPLAPSYVVGVTRFQGRIITAYSTAALLGATGWRRDPAVLLVVGFGRDRLAALDCEVIPKATAIPLRAVEAASVGKDGTRELLLDGQEPIRLVELASLEARVQEARRAG